MRVFFLAAVLAAYLVVSFGCAVQESRLAERIRIRKILIAGGSCGGIQWLDRTGMRICLEEKDRLRLERLARELPDGLEPFDPRDAFLCLYPPTVQHTPWSKPEISPGFECQVPERIMQRLR